MSETETKTLSYIEKQFLKVDYARMVLGLMGGVEGVKLAGIKMADCLVDSGLMFYASSKADVSKIRKFLRNYIGYYHDKVESVCAYGDTGQAWYFVYSGEDNVAYIKLETPVSKFPTLKEGCGFHKVERKLEAEPERIRTEWAYSCEASK